jgi:hypothetical protein
MTDKEMVLALHDLVADMLRMLIGHEIKVKACNLALQRAQQKFIDAQVPWDLMGETGKILTFPTLRQEAEAEYAPVAALLQQLTPENLEIALAMVRRRIKAHEE